MTNEQLKQARTLWGQGKTLGEIAQIMGLSVYDLSPWLINPNQLVEPN